MLFRGPREALVCVFCEGVSSRMTLSFTWPDWCRAEAVSSGLAVSFTWLDRSDTETVAPGQTVAGTTEGGSVGVSL